MKNIFVTGGTGFTGSYLVKELTDRGYKVTALVRNPEKRGLLNEKGVRIVTGDISKPETLKGILKNIDTVFNIAALYRQEGVSKDQFFKVNSEGTRKLLEESVKSGVKRFIHCSTVGVQGEIKDPPADENAPYNPGDHYQNSKLAGEKTALEYFNNGKIGGVVVRPVGIYGPGDTRFLKLFHHIYRGSFKMIGRGKVLYHLTYVTDLVEGIILAGENKNINNEIFTLGGNEYIPLDELVSLIAGILDKKVSKIHIPYIPVYIASYFCEILCRPLGIEPPLFRRRLDFFTKDRAFKISKAKKILGYDPKIPLEKGLKYTADSYLKNKLI